MAVLIFVFLENLGYGWLAAEASLCLLPGKKGKKNAALRMLLFFGMPGFPLWIGDENLLFLFGLFLPAFYFLYDAPWFAKLVTGCVLFTLFVPVNMILDTAVRVDGDTEGAVVAAGKLIFAALVFLFVRNQVGREMTIKLPKHLWGMSAFLVAAPLFAVCSFSFWSGFERAVIDGLELRRAYTVLPFAAVSAAALIAAMAVLSRQQELEQAARLSEMREVYYEDLRNREQQMRTLRHDLRNHLNVLQGLLERKEMEKAQDYLKKLVGSPALQGSRRICANELVNVVLCCKQEEMENLKLKPDILVAVPENLPIADMDLCALFGNALDNAIEAAESARDRVISVQARADCGMLMLRVENSFGVPPKADGDVFATTKKDQEKHGFGIRGMREIASRYGGTLETAVSEDKFELVICIPFDS